MVFASGGAAGDGAYDVICLEARILQNGNAHGFEDAADIWNLVAQVERHFGAIGFVFGELGHAGNGRAALEDGCDELGRVALREFPEHVVEDVDRFGGKPGAGPHRRRAAAGARVVGTEDESERVDQE